MKIDAQHIDEPGHVVLDITAADEDTAHAVMAVLEQRWATSGITPYAATPACRGCGRACTPTSHAARDGHHPARSPLVRVRTDAAERLRRPYVGIDVTTTALSSGARGTQLAGRASLIECGAPLTRPGRRQPFRELITSVQTALGLRAHRSGTLPPPRCLSPPAHRRPDREPDPADPPGRDHRDPRWQRTHHEDQPRPDPH
ncbi:MULTISPECIES: DUF6207 family protein [unclassified Streptomyces]|uniref:DUF6207 family protein n=1 Tax=unclassified Streptomyces TaxID=2593676 RepID=UPI002B1D898E|nr:MULTISPECIES: DUF6207 family protein [unclassified Streptomyces]